MRQIKLAPIVEGDGEVPSVPILLRRICTEVIPHAVAHVLTPIRQPREKLLANKDDCLAKSIRLAVNKLHQLVVPDSAELILLLVDADKDCAANLAPAALQLARDQRSDMDIACVLAVVEYETWFAAGAESLLKYLLIDDPSGIPINPEQEGRGKGWIKRHFRGAKYSETVDQPKLTAAMDLHLCRARSPSFDKLCRELESRLQA